MIGPPGPAFKLNQPDVRHPLYWKVYEWDATADSYRPVLVQSELGPLQPADVVGSGCWVVARRVLEVVDKPLNSQ